MESLHNATKPATPWAFREDVRSFPGNLKSLEFHLTGLEMRVTKILGLAEELQESPDEETALRIIELHSKVEQALSGLHLECLRASSRGPLPPAESRIVVSMLHAITPLRALARSCDGVRRHVLNLERGLPIKFPSQFRTLASESRSMATRAVDAMRRGGCPVGRGRP